MKLLDHLRPKPRWMHPDPVVRAAAVHDIPEDDQELLGSIARGDADPRVRREAVRKLAGAAALADVARSDADEEVRAEANGILLDIALGASEPADESAALAALAALSEGRHLLAVVKGSPFEAVGRAALFRLLPATDPKTLGTVARHASHAATRLEALAHLSDPVEIASVALKAEHKDVALGAVERVSDQETLKAIGVRARNKLAARRAKAILRGLEEAARPREEDRQRRREVCERLEAAGRSENWQRLESELARARAAWGHEEHEGHEAHEEDRELRGRFEAAATAIERRLAAHVVEEAEQARAREDRMRQLAARIRLCETVEAIVGPATEIKPGTEIKESVPARLAAARSQWERLEPIGDAQDADVQAVYRRFERACRGCEARHEQRVAQARLEAGEAEAREARARDAAAREARARELGANLARLEQLCDQLERLARSDDLTLKDVERGLREARTVLDAPPPLPSKRDHEAVVIRLKAIQAGLFPRLQELREIDEWQRWANASVQEKLCARVEALRAVTDLERAARELREIQAEWQKVGAAPKAQSQALWQRFKTAADEVRARSEAYFAEQAQARAANLLRKEALAARAAALADSTDWLRTAQELQRLQAEWKTIGPVARGREREVWERFRAACGRFFTRRHEDLARLKVEWSKNLARKEGLCQQAEAAAASSDWEAAAVTISRLRTEWKTVGPIGKSRQKRADELWRRFREACDRFSDRYAERDKLEVAASRAERERLCGEIESMLPQEPGASGPLDRQAGDVAGAVRALRAQWQKAGVLPRDQAAALNERFAQALMKLVEAYPAAFRGTDLDPEANRRKMEDLCARVERYLAEFRHDAAATPAARLAAEWREALAANTIGGRVDEEARWQAAMADVRNAQAAWQQVGPVPPEVRAPLAERFESACRRFFARRR